MHVSAPPDSANEAMKTLVICLGCAFILAGCATNDFKVVDALSVGMSDEQAKESIESYGFQREARINRPDEGWPDTDDSFTDLPGRAHSVEKELNTVIECAEHYPVGHGLLGAGDLFLFYDETGHLVKYYRRHIN